MAKRDDDRLSGRGAFAARLRALRLTYGETIGQPGLSMAEFAALLGVEAETYRRYERGETEPNIRTLTTLRKLTGVRLDALIAGELDSAA